MAEIGMQAQRASEAVLGSAQAAKWAEQDGRCAICGEPLERHGAEMDGRDPVLGYMLGYTVEDIGVTHHACHVGDQKAKGYA